MAITDSLTSYFKPEERKRGEDLARKDAVVISSASDTGVRAYIRAAGAGRVSLSSVDVESTSVTAQCSCSSAAKGLLCKHVWAVLLKLEDKGLDFLESKTEIEMLSAVNERKSEAVARQTEYKKQAYQKQKSRAKEIRRAKKQSHTVPAFNYPSEVEEAREYFAANGFELKAPIEIEELMTARKQLARVFHPDKGGTHDEVLELNRHFEAIQRYFNS